MSTRSPVALITFALATVASVATSSGEDVFPRIAATEHGEAVRLDVDAPDVSLYVHVETSEIPEDAIGELTLTLTPSTIPSDVALDFVLVHEADSGDVTLDQGSWTADVGGSVDLFGADVSHDSATYRVDVALVGGASALVDWTADVRFDVGDEEPTGGVVLTLDPAPAEED